MRPAMDMAGERLNPAWAAVWPALAMAALATSPAEQRLLSILVSAFACLAAPVLSVQARFRTKDYFSPVNVALLLLQIKIVLVPALLMVLGYENKILALTPAVRSMEGAVLVDTAAFIAFCAGLHFAAGRPANPGRLSLLPALSGTPGQAFVYGFAFLGLVGLYLTFGSVGRLIEYFSDPAAVIDSQPGASVGEFLGTMLRPFFAFALVTWWARIADRHRDSGSRWIPILAGLAAATGITAANLTYGFNRGAVVFPLVSLLAVYSMRIRRIPPAVTFTVFACCVPLLLAVATFRANSQLAQIAPEAERKSGAPLAELTENIVVYCGGPQLTGVFYESLDWGDRLFGGSTLISSIMSPIPILGKGFREESGPIVYNHAIYGTDGIDDQIPPFASELFGNLHIAGVVAGFVGLGLLLAMFESWLYAVDSTFGAFVVQYIAVWGAMLTVWSLSVYVQILFYFLGPVYLYLAIIHVRGWLRRAPAPGIHFPMGVRIQ